MFFEDSAKILFGGAGRRAVIIRQIEVRDAKVKGSMDHRTGSFQRIDTAKVVPQAKRDGGQQQTTASGAAVSHGRVPLLRGSISHGLPRSRCTAACRQEENN